MRRITALVALLAAAVAIAAPQALAAKGPKDNDTRVQLLAFNDFHGHLEPNTPGTIQVGCCVPNSTNTAWTPSTVPAGGVEYFATHLKGLRTANTNTITVGAGDLIGASPLISGLFHDEPAIHSLNALGLDVSGVGNHEFDEGLQELYRMQFGGCTGARPLRGRAVPGCDLPVPRGERGQGGNGRDDPPGLRDQEDRQREDRVHRPDARGDTDDRDAVGRCRSRVPARGGDDERARREAAERTGCSRRSSCCSTRAASRTRLRPVPSRARRTRPATPTSTAA